MEYFHVVFTLPQELRQHVRRHQKILYGVIIKAAAKSLIKLAADADEAQQQKQRQLADKVLELAQKGDFARPGLFQRRDRLYQHTAIAPNLTADMPGQFF